MATETPGTTGPKYDTDKVYNTAFRHVRPPYPSLALQSGGLNLLPVGSIKALKGSFSLKSTLNTEYTLPVKLDGWQMPQEPVIMIRGGKNIKETALNRGDRVQNVLEEMNLNNYQIRIHGVIINEVDFDAYPEEAVRRLREILEKAGSVSIENGLTSIWNITKVAFKDWEIRDVQGYIGAQAFEIDCLSDEDFELELVEDPERL